MQARIEQTFGIFPKPAAFLQPGERPFDNPTLGDDREGMQFTPFGDLHRSPDQVPDGVGERLAGIAAIHQNRSHRRQAVLVLPDGVERTLAVGVIRCGDRHRMGQPLRVNHDMPFDAGHLFSRIIALGMGAVRVFHALRVNDAKTRLGVAPLSLSGRANLIFLRPAPAGSRRFQVGRSTKQNNGVRYATSGSRWATSAIGSRFSASTGWHRTRRTNQHAVDGFSCGPFPAGL